MNLENIKEGSTIIAPSNRHNFLRHQLLANQSAIPNVRILTLQAFLQDNLPNKDTSIYEYYQILKVLKSELTYNKDCADTYSFIKEIKEFIKDMKQYNIALTSLPTTNVFQEENKQIIESLLPVSTSTDMLLKQWQKHLQHTDFTSIFIFDECASMFEKKIYTSFIEKGAQTLSIPTSLQSKQWYSALNPRQEVESVAQYILQHELHAEEVHISYLSPIYLPYIHQIFARYKIPYYVFDEKEKPDILQRFLALIQYYLKPNMEHLRNLFLTHTFQHTYANEFVEYVQIHQKNIYDDFSIMKDVCISEDIIAKQERDTLLSLEEKANIVKADILADFVEIFKHTSILDFLLAVDAYLCKSHPFHNKEDRQALLKIRSEIKKAKNYLHTKEDLAFFEHRLKDLDITLSCTQKGAFIAPFTHVLNIPYKFVLGCTQDLYPAFPSKNGIFDEAYYATLDYPSLEDRYAHHLYNYAYILSACEHLILFSPISSIDGKACETSLEIEQFMECKPMRYPLLSQDNAYKRTYTIAKQHAKDIFVKEDYTIHGSISSLERYMKCPYSYFLRYGLRIKEPVDYTFNVAKCGTLIHYVLEQLINLYGKDYVHASEVEINALLEEKIKEIILLYPNEKYMLLHIQKRLVQSILTNLKILKDHEEHSSLNPTECEYSFDYAFPIDDTYKILLHGIIDRIDTNQDFMRVIDYKSSAHSLKEDHVFSAQQLQLVTYLMIAQNDLQKRPLGAFYYSLALPSVKMEAGKLKKRPLMYIPYTEEDYFAQFLKNNRMHGWVCGEQEFYIEPMDDNANHIVGVSNSKTSGLTTRTVYKFSTLSEYMNALYKQIGKRILAGHIACESSEDACTYCPYTFICMRSKLHFDKEELIEIKPELYLKGGRNYDDME